MPEAFPLDRPLHVLACDRQPLDREALVHVWEDGKVDRLTFAEVALASQALAKRLQDAAIGPGVRVAVSLPQSTLAPVAHLAISRAGAVSVPLSPMLGPDALAPRLAASGAALAIVDAPRTDAFREAAPGLPLWRVEGRNLKVARGEVAHMATPWPPADDAGESPMSLFFTSGTTATPKGVVLPHRVVPGRMPGFLAAHPDLASPAQGTRRFWSPAEWSWIGGLHDALFAPWLAGCSVFSYQRTGHFDPARAADLLEAFDVRHAFLPPTALKTWRRSGAATPRMRSIHTAGEPLAAPVHEWAQGAFGCPVREVYGLTECAFILVNAAGKEGITGRPSPGATLALREGEVCIRRGAPTIMLGYLDGEGWTLPLDADGWLHAGDVAETTPEGDWRVLGRLDDVIKTSGYRVAPGEVEAELLRHPAVAECAVVGEPDDARGEAIVAYVKVAPGHTHDGLLRDELVAFVRKRLAPYLVPRRLEFVEDLPTTLTGKIRRRALR